jgi:anti-sigma factor RsiW
MSELVTDYMEGALPPARWLAARVHLLLCPACRRFFGQMRATIQLLASCSWLDASEAVAAQLLAKLPDANRS